MNNWICTLGIRCIFVIGSPVRDLDAGGTMTLVRSLTGEAGILQVLNINGAHSLHSVAPNAS